MLTLTHPLAMAAAQDAGDRAMRAAGRSAWNVGDWNAACDAFARLNPREDHATPEPRQAGPSV